MKTQMIPFEGGIVTEGPLLARPPGSCLLAINYEIAPQRGYRRINGYSLYDGSPSPSSLSGSGPVRGVFIYKEIVYAIRDNTLGTAGILWKSTVTGWVQVAATLPTGGKYKFKIHNFFGASNLLAVYGVNEVGKAFKFDGTTLSFITTGMTVDVPVDIEVFRNFLFLSFAGGSVQHSAAGAPDTWSPILGAAELAIGDDHTGFSVETEATLAIFARNKTYLLTGTGAIIEGGLLDWQLKVHSSETGSRKYSAQRIGQTIFLDDRGIFNLQATDAFGGFELASLSTQFRPLVKSFLTDAICGSLVLKEKNQYRAYSETGKVLSLSFDGNGFIGATTIEYPNPMRCVFAGEINDIEVSIGGDDNGNVYLLDNGNSFNGHPIRSYMRLQYYHYGDPSQRKRFRRIHMEAESEGDSIIYVEPDFNYSSSNVPKSILFEYDLGGTGGVWDIDEWDGFVWALPLASTTPIRMQGVGFNMSPLFFHESNSEDPFIIYGMIVDFDKRGRVR